MRNQNQVVSACRRCNQQIIRTDELAPGDKFRPNRRIMLSAVIVEGQGDERHEEALEKPQVSGNPRTVARSVKKLGFGYRAEPDFGWILSAQPGNQRGRGSIEKLDAYVRVEQKHSENLTLLEGALRRPPEGSALPAADNFVEEILGPAVTQFPSDDRCQISGNRKA